ncbi:Phosphotyrosyl phosphatase activator [Dendrothele bispora CBS 962.96]|uniref:Serine/threonine-protein phosphatase 2A activator n=1 Tax=Dendrothele bispora (strain CBS 962.96) TaxID=1314807 RepID=A0A4S8M7R3_DENBC|nr:Phosphotyrosyl phosphatase activator [Dendrothele bispora CBS 962.96]
MAAVPELPQIPLSLLEGLALPKQVIKTDHDVEIWRTTRSYKDYSVFLHRLTESVVGVFLPWSSDSHSQAIESLITLLDTLDSWIDEIPPLDTPQRFGNLAIRTWGKRLEERSEELLSALLPSEMKSAVPHLKPYFMSSFGSFIRMDYGTGHETSFALFLLALTLVRFFQPVPEEERALVLRVFVRYLRLCWRLQDVYRLEPAGSHGVWGLDDSHFLGYIFGSGQLRDQTEIPVSAILKSPLPPTNLYFMSVMRIHEVKQGPFYEHSPQLHTIAVGVPNWNKVNSGMFKMYEAEVLGKRVVVQHIPLGGLLGWNDDGFPGSVKPASATRSGHPTSREVTSTQTPSA